MTAYMIVQTFITDAEKMEDYKALAAPAVAKYGGKYLSRGGPMEHIENELGRAARHPARVPLGGAGEDLLQFAGLPGSEGEARGGGALHHDHPRNDLRPRRAWRRSATPLRSPPRRDPSST